MKKMPRVSGDEVKAALEKCGFEEKSQKGSHLKMRHADGRTAIVPMHRELKFGTMKSIMRQAKLTLDELLELLGR